MKYIIASLLLVLLAGCGETSSKETGDDVKTSTQDETSSQTIVDMQQNVSYSVYKGDELKKTSTDAKVSITKSLQGESTSVVLLEGTAQIIRAE